MVILRGFLCVNLCCLWYSGSALDLETCRLLRLVMNSCLNLVIPLFVSLSALNLSVELWIIVCLLESGFLCVQVNVGYLAGLCDSFCLESFYATVVESLVVFLCFVDRLRSQGLRLRFLRNVKVRFLFPAISSFFFSRC
jgi:hypothetical protein